MLILAIEQLLWQYLILFSCEISCKIIIARLIMGSASVIVILRTIVNVSIGNTLILAISLLLLDFRWRLNFIRVWGMWAVMSDYWILSNTLSGLVGLCVQIWCWVLLLLLSMKTFILTIWDCSISSIASFIVTSDVIFGNQWSRDFMISIVKWLF